VLEVQKLLLASNDVRTLTSSGYGIRVTQHETLPLMILNYDQLESPRDNPVTKECRGLVLRSDNYELVSRSFGRFWNWGEFVEQKAGFDWGSARAYEKLDGSLINLFNFRGSWFANTRGSFGNQYMQFQSFTWREGVERALGASLDAVGRRLDPTCSYALEFTSPWNTVVRKYPKPELHLLAKFRGEEELSCGLVDHEHAIHYSKFFTRPTNFNLKSPEAVTEFLQERAKKDPTFEGVVLVDKNKRRWKFKSSTYLALHHLKDNGNLYNPKNIVPIILSGEASEACLLLSEIEGGIECFNYYNKMLEDAYEQLEKCWFVSQGVASQKKFAELIVGNTPFTGILFQLRKTHGEEYPVDALRKAWRNSETTLVEYVKKQPPYKLG
jgi:hypothetical protein